ncbi:MAG: TRAP transporter large permease [Desulfobacterales bacterium]|nr:TRAP transporter large permease [Desulfobacterales bacterium]MDD4073539.1 TRAP transporter large permease [Desulfobacterales bacterium]MDD4394166.1 TRAP transporter large permease [Desulfobacterales bacterium]
MSPEISMIAVFATLSILTLLGAPIFLSLGFSSLVGMFMVRGVQGLFQLPASMMGQLDSFLLVALPLYIFMGEVLNRSGIGAEIYDLLEKWLRRIPGGLAIASILSCAVFGAMCGVSIAGVAAIGVVAIPEMLKRGYNRPLAAGSVTAAGALAVLIPPSISFIIYGAISGVSVAKLFIAGIVPGVILSLMMASYVLLRVLKNPALAPLPEGTFSFRDSLAPLYKLWPVIFLLTAVLGTIYCGIATPTEAGAIGAVGALFVVILRRKVTVRIFIEILTGSMRIASMLLIIMAAAFAFGQYLNLVRLPLTLSRWVIGFNVSPMLVIVTIMIFLIMLGMFIDGVSLIIVTTPVILPTIIALGYDPLWYGVLLVLNLEIATITPPVGLNLYAMKSAIDDLKLGEILKGTLPYVIVEAIALTLFLLCPRLAMWLPNTM